MRPRNPLRQPRLNDLPHNPIPELHHQEISTHSHHQHRHSLERNRRKPHTDETSVNAVRADRGADCGGD
ncbi:hypothetical protein SAICODRAFT_32809 [Saitoella complicata NRRL Y-17804]|uniref:uncharacterized protein n=1 Tax=Saitoella complicata (strain BCRC 22490 / CBS 7301 / JCM 7358 / NBRC 10748 / NRRL Y-17804) TaxID=698492 RepID=UPI000867F3DF|nr:uncharacterized protein SAICODRAFT_32809 [Saitoella complicata NRRL Y-17804]ODQ56417.1 hypothetical protein SAICODRAFT_32809 [Saitoella complicata NRRL Y-17804]